MHTIEQWYFYAPAPIAGGALSDDARLTSVCLSHTSGLSREQRPMKTKIGKEVAHKKTWLGTTTFKVKRSKVDLQGVGHIVAASRTACSGCYWKQLNLVSRWWAETAQYWSALFSIHSSSLFWQINMIEWLTYSNCVPMVLSRIFVCLALLYL